MPPIIRVGEPTIEWQGDRLFAIFKLSEKPDKKWIQHFKDRAVYSIFPVVNSVVKGTRCVLNFPGRKIFLS